MCQKNNSTELPKFTFTVTFFYHITTKYNNIWLCLSFQTTSNSETTVEPDIKQPANLQKYITVSITGEFIDELPFDYVTRK